MDKKLGNNNNKDHIWNKMTGYIYFFQRSTLSSSGERKERRMKEKGATTNTIK